MKVLWCRRVRSSEHTHGRYSEVLEGLCVGRVGEQWKVWAGEAVMQVRRQVSSAVSSEARNDPEQNRKTAEPRN